MNDFLTAYYDDDAGQQRIGSQAELDELLDRVASLPRPTWLELVSADELATMNIGLGAAFSSLTLYDDVDGSAKVPLSRHPRRATGSQLRLWRRADDHGQRQRDHREGGPRGGL